MDFCRFHEQAYIRNKIKVFTEVCHSCGGCALVCPEKAVSEHPVQVGHLETGVHKSTTIVTGFLNIGEASGVPVIKEVRRQAEQQDHEITVIDCPPGSACTVMESIEQADYCILAGEPTIFGLHNFQMVHELVSLMGKPCGVVINKALEDESVLDRYCMEHDINILERIPYSEKTASLGAKGKIAVEEDPAMAEIFSRLLKKVSREVAS